MRSFCQLWKWKSIQFVIIWDLILFIDPLLYHCFYLYLLGVWRVEKSSLRQITIFFHYQL